MDSRFLAVLERVRPGSEEHLIALVYVQDGRTVWFDAGGEQPYAAIPPDEAEFEALQSSVEQGDRRLLLVSADHFEELKAALCESVEAAVPA